MSTGFCVLHSNRFEGMRDLLVEWIRRDPLSPLENEVVLVQNKGMGQWLKMALAAPDALGVAAAIETPLPAQFLWHAYRTVLADENIPEHSPFDRAALTWRLMDLLPESFATEPLRRYELACQLAALYDQYQVYRADWLTNWRDGGSVGAEQYPWQPELWRQIVASVPQAQRGLSRAFIHQRFLDKCTGVAPAGLPRRVVVFGVTSLPRQFIEGLGALSKFCQVFMLVNNPSPEYWGGKDAHPLLSSWGRQGADYLDLLLEFDQWKAFEGRDLKVELFADPGKASSLARVQSSIFNLEPAVEGPLDDTIRFHVAHSPQREVEVLHDELLARFEDDPTLQPRDVVVMVPDIDAYAPHIEAAFTQIRYGIADRHMRTVDPILKALEWVLGMPERRFGVHEVLDLLDVGAIQRRFGLHADDLPGLRRAAAGANIRWGLDGAQRASLDLPEGFTQNSWRFGLDRMLLGYASGSAESWHGIEPYAETDAQSAEAVGKLIALIEVLAHQWRALREPRPVAAWTEVLRALIGELFLHRDEDDLKTLIRLHDALDILGEDCTLGGFGDDVPIEVVAKAWLAQVEDSRRLGRFLEGAVTFCTLVPMRSIPFRMVCLLGMNDGDFPRVPTPQDFDLLARREHYRPGDRSRRDDDRYQFLEAVLAAREHLHISWVGRSIRDNAPRPPSVLVSQLMHLLGNPEPIEHPLQPFSAAYFTEGGPSTYATQWNPPPRTAKPHVTALPALDLDAPLTVRDLGVFLRQPVKWFLQRRFDIRFPDRTDRVDELEPFELSPIDAFATRDALFHGRADLDTLIRSGTLPSGFIGAEAAAGLDVAAHDARALFEGKQAQFGPALPLVAVEHTHAGITVRDDILGVLDVNAESEFGLVWGTGNPLAKDRKLYRLTHLWVQHLLLCSGGHRTRSLAVGSDGAIEFAPLSSDHARTVLDTLLEHMARGLCNPLPIECKTALAAFVDGTLDLDEARDMYMGGFGRSGQIEWASEVARFYPEFSELASSGFVEVAVALYGPMVEAST